MDLKPQAAAKPSLLAGGAQPNLLSDPVYTPIDNDSIERITVLGAEQPNPYLIPKYAASLPGPGL